MYQTDIVVHSVGKVWSTILRKNDAIGQMAKGQSVVICIVTIGKMLPYTKKIISFIMEKKTYIIHLETPISYNLIFKTRINSRLMCVKFQLN